MARSDEPTDLGEVLCLVPAIDIFTVQQEALFEGVFTYTDPVTMEVQNLATGLVNLRSAFVHTVAAQGGNPATNTVIASILDAATNHLGSRLLHRAAQLEIADKTVEAIKFQGEYIGERLAQHLQFQEGKDSISESDIPEVLPVDKAQDIDTGGELPP